MIFRASRGAGNDRFLEVKAALLVIGAALGLIGMVSERSWLVWVGIGIVGAGLIFKLVAARKDRGNPD